jgi:type VI secretion system protein ImpF
MAEPTSAERLQPCLLDRLTDDEPDKKEEGRNQRVISPKRYKDGVQRDLMWLLNASAHVPVEGAGDREFRLSDYPEAYRSVLNFGTRQLAGLVAPDMQSMERELVAALQVFEPRILRRSLKVQAQLALNQLTITLWGQLWANPMPEELYICTRIDIETGQCSVSD